MIPLSRNASFRHTQSSSLIEAVNGLFDFLSPFPDLPMTSSTPSSTSPDSAQPQCRHRAWRILGVVGLCLYFLICTILLAGRWFFTTQIDNYRNEITQLSSDYLGVQVEAEKITGGFSKFWPTLTLEKVRFSQPGGGASLELPKIEARFSWSSLWSMSPRFQTLQIISPSLSIHRTGEYAYNFAGWTVDFSRTQRNNVPSSGAAQFYLWLLSQTKLSLIDGDVIYRDEVDPKNGDIHLTNIQILFEQHLLDWRVGFRARLLKESGEENMHIAGNVEKNFFHKGSDPLTWKGNLYAKTDFIDVARLVKSLKLPLALSSGTGAIEFWSKFQEGRLIDLVSDINVQGVNVELPNALEPLDIAHLSTRVTYEEKKEKSDSSRLFTLKNLFLQTVGEKGSQNNHLGYFAIGEKKTDPANTYSVEVADASISNWKRLLPALPIKSETRDSLSHYSVDGHIQHLSLSNQGGGQALQNWLLNARFDDLSFKVLNSNIPSFTGLSGSIKSVEAGQYTLNLDSKNSSLTFPGVFKRPTIPVTALQTHARVTFTPQLKVEFTQLSARNSEAQIAGQGYWLDTGDIGTLNISGKILRADGRAVENYLPLAVGNSTLNWLDNAILAGTITSGVFEVKGPLRTIPWHKSTNPDEHFLIDGIVKNGKLNFFPTPNSTSKKPAWPLLTDITARLIFEGNSMRIEGTQGTSLGLKSSNAVVKIDDFAKPILNVDAAIVGDLKNALRYLKESDFLASILGSTFDQTTGSGSVQTQLALSIPLGIPEHTSVKVVTDFKKTKFSYGFNLPEINELTGQLVVTEDNISTPVPFSGKTGEGTINVRLSTAKKQTHIDISGHLSAHEALNLLEKNPFKHELTQTLKGKFPIAADVVFGLEQPLLRISGKSNLEGLESTLPAPLSKEARHQWPVDFIYDKTSEHTATLKITAPDRADIHLAFATPEFLLKSGHIIIGAHKALPPTKSGVQFLVNTPTLDLDAWQKVLTTDQKSEQPFPLVYAALHASQSLRFKDQVFQNATFEGQLDNTIWHIGLQSTELAGSLQYQPKTANHAAQLSGTIDRLHLTTKDDDDGVAKTIALSEVKSSVDSLPDLMLNVKDLSLNQYRLGSINIDATNEGQEIPRWYLRSMKVLNTGGLLNVHGVWYPGARNKSNATIKLSVTDMGKLLSSLNYANAVCGAAGSIEATLSWQGSPLDFNARTLDGSISGDFSQGEFLQIEPGAGRILSLLSLQHLLKRLTFDFRDVFGTGFAFDSLHLEGTVSQGLFTTPKMSILGSAASVLTVGRINLVAETLDLKSVILPSINVGGPSLALALVNPAVGIGTFVSQWVFQDQISQLFKSEYLITGTFDDPTVTKLGGSKPSQE